MHARRQTVTAAGGAVTVDVNIAARNKREAELSIALALFVILELTVFISVLNNTAMELLVSTEGLQRVSARPAGVTLATLLPRATHAVRRLRQALRASRRPHGIPNPLH